jgi:tRNA threonylcarbamoyladenosine biosynthesis protein TsaB
MNVLAVELSTTQGSLAWWEDGDPMVQLREWPNDRKNSAQFFENLQSMIQRFGSPDKIIVGLGPGSYAGVRIAISAAIGLSAAAVAELVGYPSVCAIKHGAREYAVIGDARRQSFFFVRINNRSMMGDYELLSQTELNARLEQLPVELSVFSSDLLPQFKSRVEQACPSAEILAQLVNDAGKRFVFPPLEPIYLRGANITMPKPITRGASQ